MSTAAIAAAARPSSLGRTRSVAGIGKLTGAYFALRGAVVLFCVHVLHLEPSAGSAAALALGPALLLLLAFHSLGAVRCVDEGGRGISLRKNPVLVWLCAYLIFAGASLLWGVTVSPLSSGAYWCGLVLDAAIIVLLLSLYPRQEVAESVLRGYVLGAYAIAALAWIMPAQVDLRLGDPDFFNTNQIANVCAFGILFVQYLARRGKGRLWLPVFVLSLTLLRTLSKTTLLAAIVSQGILLFRDPEISARTRRRVLLCAAGLLIASSGLLASYYDVYTNAGNQAETLTGRTAIWAWAIDKVPDSPWIGHGFDSMWKVMPPFGIDRFEARHAENELLQQLYAYGVVGTALFLGVYVTFFRAIRKSADKRTRLLLKIFLLFIVLRGLAEAEPFDLLLPVWVLVLFAATVVEPEATDPRLSD